MAILNGLLRKMSGSAGDLTFKTLNGLTVVSEKVTKMTNPRSDAQMRVRTRWSNVVAMYSGVRPLLRHGFENKPAGLSDYNMFVKVNMQRTPIYLTKQAVAGGACVATAYQISQGSLPAIVVTGTGQNGVTDILLGSLSITSATTVAQFSTAVVQNNPDYRYGDQISFFLVKQKVNEETGIPYCQFSAAKVILDAANENKRLVTLVTMAIAPTLGCTLARAMARRSFLLSLSFLPTRRRQSTRATWLTTSLAQATATVLRRSSCLMAIAQAQQEAVTLAVVTTAEAETTRSNTDLRRWVGK